MLKRFMYTYPFMAIPNFLVPFTMDFDSSKLYVGVVLMQKGKSIAFESLKLFIAEWNFSMYDKEMLAIMHAILDRLKQYLFCRSFII